MFRKRSSKMLLTRDTDPPGHYRLFPPGSHLVLAPHGLWVHARAGWPPLVLWDRDTHRLYDKLLEPGQGPLDVTITIKPTSKLASLPLKTLIVIVRFVVKILTVIIGILDPDLNKPRKE